MDKINEINDPRKVLELKYRSLQTAWYDQWESLTPSPIIMKFLNISNKGKILKSSKERGKYHIHKNYGDFRFLNINVNSNRQLFLKFWRQNILHLEYCAKPKCPFSVRVDYFSIFFNERTQRYNVLHFLRIMICFRKWRVKLQSGSTQ